MSQPFVWLCEENFVITIFIIVRFIHSALLCCATGEQKATVVRTEQETGIVKFYKHFFGVERRQMRVDREQLLLS